MIEEEFAAADYAPDEIFKDFSFLFAAGLVEKREDLAGFVCGRESGEADKEDLVKKGGVIGEVFEPASNSVVRDGEFLVDGVTI